MIPTAPPAARPHHALAARIDWALVAWIGVFLLLFILPSVAAWVTLPPGALYTGFAIPDTDHWVCIATIREGFEGHWLFQNPFADGPHQPIIGQYFCFLLLGHLAKWTGLSLFVVYQIGRLVGIAFLLYELDRLLALLWPEGSHRRWAFVLILLGTGFGWINEANGYWGDARLWPSWLLPIDLFGIHMTTFGTLLRYAHYPWALWLMLATYRLAYEAETAKSWPWLGAVAAMALGWHHPYDVVPVFTALGLWFLPRIRRHGWPSLGRLALIAGPGMIPIAYYYWVFTYHPVLATWGKQHVTRSPSLLVLLAAVGFALLYALPGLTRRQEPRRLWTLLACWTVVQGLLVYAPVGWKSMMLMGLPLVLMIWGARGLLSLGERWPNQRRALLVLGVALVLPGPLTILHRELGTQRYLTADEAALSRWLSAGNQDGRPVLSYVLTGNRIVGLAGRRVLLGHHVTTPDYDVRNAEAQRWYQGQLGDEWLQRRRIGIIVWGPFERRWTQTPPVTRPPDFQQGAFQAWRVAPAGG